MGLCDILPDLQRDCGGLFIMQNSFEILKITQIIENDELFAHAIYSLTLICSYSDEN